jgi:predicted O-methyltransferase YrrM
MKKRKCAGHILQPFPWRAGTLKDSALKDSRMTQSAPISLAAIEAKGAALGFDMSSDPKVGALLAALAASKPGGRILELGTGVGVGAAWLLHGMDQSASLLSLDTDERVLGVAREHLGSDPRVQFAIADAAAMLSGAPPRVFDMIFADAWAGKFSHLDEAISALKPGGLYVVDDLSPQPNWPRGHQETVDAYLAALERRDDLLIAHTGWATGVLIATKRG